MSLETATYISSLVVSNPDGGDARSTSDDHLRLIKAVLKRTFPLMDGAVSLSSAQVMFLGDLSASVQLQLNQLRDGSATANFAVNSRYANSASLALYANSASLALYANSASFAAVAAVATLALTANSASYAAIAGTAATATTATSAINATNATNATNASNAAFATSAGSAALLSGLAPSDTGGANTIVQRNSSGYIFGAYFNQSSSEGEGGAITSLATFQGDNYFRKATLAQLGAQLEARNITNKAGTRKTLLAGSGPPNLAGSTNGDIWEYY